MSSKVEGRLAGLVEWMSNGLGCPISSSYDPSTCVYFLHPESPRVATLRVSLGALEDRELPAILEDLEREGLLERLSREPAFWPMYTRARTIEHVERLFIPVDGSQYMVTWDREHNVRVFGPDGKLLRNHPTGVLTNPKSVFERSAGRWEAEIRAWR